MRHYKKGRKLGTDASHTKAMKKSLVSALFLNDRIKTVEARAKEVRGDVDKVITWAKKGDIHSRRLAIAALGDKELVREIFEKVEQGMFKDRNGGYTRIMKLGNRKGDNAPMVIMELVTEPVAGKKKEAVKPVAKKAAKKADDSAKAAEVKAEKDAAEELEQIEEEIKAEAEASVEEADAAGDEVAAVEAAETAAKAEEAEKATEEAEAKVEEAKAEEAEAPAEVPAEEVAEPEAEAKDEKSE